MKFDDFTVGQKYVTKPVQITNEDIEDFARKFDPHYYHIEPQKASKHKMFGTIVASGLHTIAMLNGEWVRLGILGDEMLCGLGIDVKWTSSVYPNDSIYSEFEVINKRPNPDGESGIVTFQCIGRNQRDEIWAKVKMMVLVSN